MNKIFILLLVLSGQFSAAQIWQRYHPVFNIDLNAVTVLGPGVIVAGGGQETNDSFQVMIRSDDYGQSWIENEHDGLAPWNKSIAFSDPINGFAAGYDGRIIRTDDGGLHWGFNTYPIIRDFNKIVNVDPLTYFVAGGNRSNDSMQTIVKTSNGGANWLVMLDQPGPWLKSIFFTDTLKGLAVGDSGVILKTTNGGSVWTPVIPPIQRDFNGVTFINTDTGFIVGGKTGRRTILSTTNGGSTWTVVLDTIGGILNDISFADSLVGYAVGKNATVLKTSNGGSTWIAQSIDTNLLGNEDIRSVSFYDSGFGAIAGRFGLFYVYMGSPLPFSTFHTEQVTSVSYTTASLNGTVHGITVPMNLYFEYDTTPLFAHSVQATPSSVSDTSIHHIVASINSLRPMTTYYYRLKGVSGNNPYYGNMETFYTTTNSVDTTFETKTATNVTDISATLNGDINNFYYATPVQVSFQYGTGVSFGRETNVMMVNVNDTLSHTVSASVTGLSPDTAIYYYRLVVVAGANTYFGETRQVHTGIPEIPNWDFRDWETKNVLLPSRWYLSSDSFARVPGHSGNYALQLTGPVVAVMGIPSSHLVGGAPFNSRPDSISVYMKYAIEVGDTAYAALYLSKNGNSVSPFTTYPITGNSGGIFKRMSFPVSYSSSLIPDSILMVFMPSNAFGERDTVHMLSSLTVDDISFSPSTSNVPNFDFESWYNYSVERAAGWKTLSYLVDSASLPVVPMASKVLLNTPGDYAIQMQNMNVGGVLVYGELTTYENFFKNTPDFPVSRIYQVLTGYYEFFPENGDTVRLSVGFKKGGRYGVTIGNGTYSFKQPANVLTPFEVRIYYQGNYPNDTLTPDWANISFGSGEGVPLGHTRLILDKLRFDGFVSADSVVVLNIDESAMTPFDRNGIKVYPNPSSDFMMLEISEKTNEASTIQLYGLDGQMRKEFNVSAGEIKTSFPVADIESGFYLLKWISGNKTSNKKIVVLK